MSFVDDFKQMLTERGMCDHGIKNLVRHGGRLHVVLRSSRLAHSIMESAAGPPSLPGLRQRW